MFLCAVSFISQSAIAQSPQWQVQPSICISQQAGQNCEFEVEITLLDVPEEDYCLALADQILRCANAAQFPLKLTVTISENSELSLVNIAQQKLLNTILLVKSQQASQQRRRLRNPWSLF